MKKTIISLSIIGVVAVIAIGATVAYFNDTETSTGNIFVAGEMDLKVDHLFASYNGNPCTMSCVEDPTNLIQNGSFENPEVTDQTNKWQIFQSGTAGLIWTVEWEPGQSTTYSGKTRPEPALVEYHEGVNGWLSQEGDQHTELDSDWFGPTGSNSGISGEPALVKIYQNITTVPGKEYKLYYYFSPRPKTDASDNILKVRIDGTEVASHTAGNSTNQTIWTQYVKPFTATGATTKIEFAAAGTANSLGVFLDNVVLYQINCQYQIVGGTCKLWEEKDLNEGDFFFNYYPDVKPGDYGRNIISLHAYDNDAWACLIVNDKQDNDNGLTDSEEEAGDTTGGVEEGELSQYIEVALWLDINQNNSYDADESVLFEGSLADPVVNMKVADSTIDSPLTACTTYYIGLAWCVGNQTVDQETGQITCDGSTAGDKAQTDSLAAALTAYAEQWRNNPDFECTNVILP